MKIKNLAFLSLLSVALAGAGCLTRQQLLERRIGEKADFFASLPAESQQRLQAGRLEKGDARDAAWIVYGRPDRVFHKAAGTATNEVWSYVTQGYTNSDEPRPVSHPVRTSRGWCTPYETLWAPSPNLDAYEYLRIEFEGDRVLSVQPEAPSP
jgi:hypothetical protein